VQELMDGSLAQLIQSKVVIPEEVLASIFKLLLNGLDYLHRQLRVVHRDVKPSNVLYNKEGCIKISDFGISAMLDSSTAQAATFIGTVTYMSPERLEGESYSFSADIWSVGILALELVKGHNPYWDSAESIPSDMYYDILHRLRTAGPPQLLPQNPPENFKPLYSEEFSSFISLCLQGAKQSRPSAKQLLNHDWIVNSTMSEESLDEARLHDWLASCALATSNWRNSSSQPAEENLQAALDNLIHSFEA
jgi:serine/threonine protein kinase